MSSDEIEDETEERETEERSSPERKVKDTRSSRSPDGDTRRSTSPPASRRQRKAPKSRPSFGSEDSETFGLPVELPEAFHRGRLSTTSAGRSPELNGGSLTDRSVLTKDSEAVSIARLPRTQKLLGKTATIASVAGSTSPVRAGSSIRDERSVGSVKHHGAAADKRAGASNTWHKTYLNELTYNLSTKARAKERREAEARKAQRQERERKKEVERQRARFSLHESSGDGGGAFLDRLEAVTRRVMDARATAAERAVYDDEPDKKCCQSCGRPQSFDEYKKDIKRCQRDACHGAWFRPKHVWDDVADDFLGRLDSFLVDKVVKHKQLLRESRPPFRELTKTEFNAEKGTMETVEVPTHLWKDVEKEFFERQEAFRERHEETLKRLEEERQAKMLEEAATLQGGVKLNTEYNFSSPLPDFYERQRIAGDRKKLTWEERMEEYEAKYGPQP